LAPAGNREVTDLAAYSDRDQLAAGSVVREFA
jgi:hypothetical protein